jgi:hypothetical protein
MSSREGTGEGNPKLRGDTNPVGETILVFPTPIPSPFFPVSCSHPGFGSQLQFWQKLKFLFLQNFISDWFSDYHQNKNHRFSN